MTHLEQSRAKFALLSAELICLNGFLMTGEGGGGKEKEGAWLAHAKTNFAAHKFAT